MEENKVALQVRLAQLLAEHHGKCRRDSCTNAHAYDLNPLVEAILRAPDLRVELVEPRYFIVLSNLTTRYAVKDRQQPKDEQVVAYFKVESDAQDWLNSKEPK